MKHSHKNYDVLVLGLGVTGAAALYHLSNQGIAVAGIDRYHPPHKFGSSHGESRIIRQAYFETPLYVPFVKEAYRIWKTIEQQSGKNLLLENGSLMIGARDSQLVQGAAFSAAQHQLDYTLLDHKTLTQQFPALRADENTVAVWEKAAGVLFPETCIETMLELSQKAGATLFTGETVTAIITTGDTIRVMTSKANYTTKKIVLSTGPWLNSLLPHLSLPLLVERRTVHWFKHEGSPTAIFAPHQLPVYIREYAQDKMFYGFPDLGDGIKIADTQKGVYVDADHLNREVNINEIKNVQSIAAKYFNIRPKHVKSSVCMYTMTPDEHFIIDRHPLQANIIIGSPCSGHGFKFASATGKILADLAMEKEPTLDIRMFRANRFDNVK